MLTIKKLDINGNGIAYINKKVAFVKHALPGEVVLVKKTKEHKNYIEAEVEKVIKPSPDRVKPICPIYDECGGCNLMHLDYKKQLLYKQESVKDAVKKYLGLPIEVKPTIGMTDPYHYRNKAQMRVKMNKSLHIGLYQEGTNFIVDLDECAVHSKAVNEMIKNTRTILEKSDVDFSNKGLKRIMVRENDDDMTLVLVSNRKLKLKTIASRFKQMKNVNLYESIIENDRQFLGKTAVVDGKARSIRSINDVPFYVRPNDFFQLNDIQTAKLYEHIESLIKGSKSVVDCYMGVGTIGIYAYDDYDLRGIDTVATSIESAKDNAQLNKVKGLFKKGTTQDVLKRWVKDGYKPDTMIFDPPRTGLEENIQTILKTKPKKVVYVSCNPSTLAKDLNQLKGSYHISAIQPFDMFPQTSHIETVTLLTLK